MFFKYLPCWSKILESYGIIAILASRNHNGLGVILLATVCYSQIIKLMLQIPEGCDCLNLVWILDKHPGPALDLPKVGAHFCHMSIGGEQRGDISNIDEPNKGNYQNELLKY